MVPVSAEVGGLRRAHPMRKGFDGRQLVQATVKRDLHSGPGSRAYRGDLINLYWFFCRHFI